MVIHEVSQKTLDWARLHIGIPTASALGNLVTPEFKIREGEMWRTYLYTKVAEAWREEPLMEISSFSVEQGEILECEALSFFALETNQAVREVGFITTDDGGFGCSPDGLLEGEHGLEIKCPSAHVHVKYLLDGKLPKDYAPQVYGSMYATGFPQWTFMSYRRNFPPLILTIKRDEEIMDKIREALAKFGSDFDDAMRKVAQFQEAA